VTGVTTRPPLFALLVLALPLAGCPAADDDDSAVPLPPPDYVLPDGDVAEVEPNDGPAEAQDLGTVDDPFVLTGSSDGCGSGGTWVGADVDHFTFAFPDGTPRTLRLEMWSGDVDMALFDADGDLVIDAAEAGLEDERIELALDPDTEWALRIRCWQGNPGTLWRLVVL